MALGSLNKWETQMEFQRTCSRGIESCDILPLKNSHLCSTPEWLVPNWDDSLVTTCPRISCFQAQSSNNRVLRQYGLVYVICEIWILGNSYVYVYVLPYLLSTSVSLAAIKDFSTNYMTALGLNQAYTSLKLRNKYNRVLICSMFI